MNIVTEVVLPKVRINQISGEREWKGQKCLMFAN